MLFLGTAEEALGDRESAIASYERAATVYPLAQSPYIALSAATRHMGHRDEAQRHIERMFALPITRDSDPWWTYYGAEGDRAEMLLTELRRRFMTEQTR